MPVEDNWVAETYGASHPEHDKEQDLHPAVLHCNKDGLGRLPITSSEGKDPKHAHTHITWVIKKSPGSEMSRSLLGISLPSASVSLLVAHEGCSW